MQNNYCIEVQDNIDPSDMHTLIAALVEFNASHAGGEKPCYLMITVRDSAHRIVGGLVGATYLGWLQISVVWMSETLRKMRYGTRLMYQAEQEALKRGCPRVFSETLSFQALPFYEKLGYKVVSEIADFPTGGTRYALVKYL